jgi:DNA-binding XRE family transcriptional regulator
MTIEHYDLFNKLKPTPAKDSCGLCDPEKSEDETTRICSYCTQTLMKIKPSVWEHLLTFSINQCFPAWFITFCGDRADYYKSKKTITVKSARFNAKLTQKQLADLLGIPARTIQRWEASGKVASMQVLRACS